MKKFIIIISVALFFLILIGGYFVYAIFSNPGEAIPLVFGDKKDLASTDGRTNILAIGVDTRDSKYVQSGTLTDTLMVISVDPLKKDVKFLSIPRDLWVTVNGSGMKINEVYAVAGLEALRDTVKDVVGVDIHYYAKADFNAVIKAVDTVGGIQVNNPTAFTDNYYPKFGWENETCGIDIDKLVEEREKAWEEENEDNEDAVKPYSFLSDSDFPCRYEAISYAAGEITLTGDEALKYARSRHSIDNGQGTDFARAKRQQLVILAVKDKILTADTLTDITKLRQLYSNFSELIETDFSINELIVAIPYIKDSTNYAITSRVLSNQSTFEEGGVLVQGDYSNYGGRYVLIPKEPSSIVIFVNEYFYGDITSNNTALQ